MTISKALWIFLVIPITTESVMAQIKDPVLSSPQHRTAVLDVFPTPRAHVNENRMVDFYLGPLIFRIPNRMLAFPWRNGESPSLPCAAPPGYGGRVKCSPFAATRSVFLILDVPADTIAVGQPAFRSAVTLGANEPYDFHDKETPEDFLQRRQKDPRFTISRAPTLDTRHYAVALVELANPPMGWKGATVDYHFIAKDGTAPGEVVCEGRRGTAPFDKNTYCVVRNHFLTEQFPVDDHTNRSIYSVEYTFPWSLIDQAPQVEAIVRREMSNLSRSGWDANSYK